jgi:UDP-N-acetylglucosamine 1-carboxyvinyltransferase
LPYPGFPTDLQAPMMTLMATAQGTSVLTERIYPDRFTHVAELNRMGAAITRQGASAVIKGVSCLSGAPVVGSDLRGTAALLLAGLAAESQTELRGLEHLRRGYENFEEQLVRVGAKIRRV